MEVKYALLGTGNRTLEVERVDRVGRVLRDTRVVRYGPNVCVPDVMLARLYLHRE
jgi:hypothetical protein